MLWPGIFPYRQEKLRVHFGCSCPDRCIRFSLQLPGTVPADGTEVLKFLERAIAWHREVSSLAQSPSNPREALLADGLRQSSVQAVRLAFDFAQAEAAILELNAARGEKSDSARSRNLMQIEAAADQRMEALQRHVDQLNSRIQAAPERLRAGLISRRDVLTAQFNLTKARRDSLHGVLGFLNAPPSGGLSATIKDMERSVPELQATVKPGEAAALSPRSIAIFPPGGGRHRRVYYPGLCLS